MNNQKLRLVILCITSILLTISPSVATYDVVSGIASNSTEYTTTANYVELHNLSLATGTGTVFIKASWDARMNFTAPLYGRFLRDGVSLGRFNLTQSVYAQVGSYELALNETAGTHYYGWEVYSNKRGTIYSRNFSAVFLKNGTYGSGAGGGNVSGVTGAPAGVLDCTGTDEITCTISPTGTNFRNDTISTQGTLITALQVNDSYFNGSVFPNSTNFRNDSISGKLDTSTYSGNFPNNSLSNYLLTSLFGTNFNTSFHAEVPVCDPTTGKLVSADGETITCGTDQTGAAGGNVSSVTAQSPLTYTGTTDVIIKDERTTYPNATVAANLDNWNATYNATYDALLINAPNITVAGNLVNWNATYNATYDALLTNAPNTTVAGNLANWNATYNATYDAKMSNPATADLNMPGYSVLNATNYTTSQGRHLENGGCDASYCIRYNLTNNSLIEALNGSTGIVDYSGTNATTVFQNTINSLVPRGALRIRTGTYAIPAPIYINSDKYIMGDGAELGTILEATNQNVIFEINATRNNVIKNLYFKGINGKAIYATGTVGNGEASSVLIQGNDFSCGLEKGIYANLISSTIEDNDFGYYGSCGSLFEPIYINGSSGSWTANANLIQNNRILNSRAAPGLYIEKGTSISIIDNIFEDNQYIGNRGVAVTIAGVSVSNILTNHFEDNSGDGQVLITESSDGSHSLVSTIESNFFTKSSNNIAYIYPTRSQSYINRNEFAGSDLKITIDEYIPRVSSFEGNIIIGANVTGGNLFNRFDQDIISSGNISISKNLSVTGNVSISGTGKIWNGSAWDWFLMPSKVFGTGVVNNNNGSITITDSTYNTTYAKGGFSFSIENGTSVIETGYSNNLTTIYAGSIVKLIAHSAETGSINVSFWNATAGNTYIDSVLITAGTDGNKTLNYAFGDETRIMYNVTSVSDIKKVMITGKIIKS